MAKLSNGTYRFINRSTGLALNIYGTSTSGIKNGTNVCLYPASTSDKMQQFKVENGIIHCAGRSQFVLDHSSGMSISATSNAHMYTKTQSSSADYRVTIDESAGYCTIKLGNGKKLTAVNASTPTPSTVPSSPSTTNRNVYWTSSSAGTKQQWEAIKIGGGSDPDPEPPVPGGDYRWPTESRVVNRWNNDGHDGVDIEP